MTAKITFLQRHTTPERTTFTLNNHPLPYAAMGQHILKMNKQTFHRFNTAGALAGLGADIKSLAKHSSQTDAEVAHRYHLGTHTIGGV